MYVGEGGSLLAMTPPMASQNGVVASLLVVFMAGAIMPLEIQFARTRLLAIENSFGWQFLPDGFVH